MIVTPGSAVVLTMPELSGRMASRQVIGHRSQTAIISFGFVLFSFLLIAVIVMIVMSVSMALVARGN
jgi:hypothetical protein